MTFFGEFIYYTVLKKGQILVIGLGIVLFILVLMFSKNWLIGYHDITGNATKLCKKDVDCVNWCDECVSLASSKICEPKYAPCICINGTCHKGEPLPQQ